MHRPRHSYRCTESHSSPHKRSTQSTRPWEPIETMCWTYHTLRSRTLSGNVTFAEAPADNSSFSNPVSPNSVCQISRSCIAFHRSRANTEICIVLDVPRNCFGGSSADFGNSCSGRDAIQEHPSKRYPASKVPAAESYWRRCTK